MCLQTPPSSHRQCLLRNTEGSFESSAVLSSVLTVFNSAFSSVSLIPLFSPLSLPPSLFLSVSLSPLSFTFPPPCFSPLYLSVYPSILLSSLRSSFHIPYFCFFLLCLPFLMSSSVLYPFSFFSLLFLFPSPSSTIHSLWH